MSLCGEAPLRKTSVQAPMSLLQKLCLGLLLFPLLAQSEIIDLATGQTISREALIMRINDSDIVLLGEIHDNVIHHQDRGALIEAIAHRRLTFVTEHLPQRAPFTLNTPLLPALESAGFVPNLWGWPQHEALYRAIAKTGYPLMGGLPETSQLRAAYQDLNAALSPALNALNGASPLSEAARQHLEDDLLAGHCGQLEIAQIKKMSQVQRLKDLSMAEALIEHAPSVLIAGDAHIRKDYGVASLLQEGAPGRKVLTLAFLEDRDGLDASIYDIAWITPAPAREDPCKAFAKPPASR